MYQHLSIEAPEEGIVIAAFNRPDAANALNSLMAQELQVFFKTALKAALQPRVILLTGTGKTFCAGADLKERKGMSEAQWKAQHRSFEDARDAIMGCPIPVIAVVNGPAYGGGLELALACDFIYASNMARFALPEATLGIMPGMGGTQTLSRAIGVSRARELIFTGRAFSAQEAQNWGMVNMVCTPETLLQDSINVARAIAAAAPLSVRTIKSSIHQGVGLPLPEALKSELAFYNTLLKTKDRHEGINAFNEKRKPRFTGE